MTRLVAIGDIHLQHGHRRNAGRLTALDQVVREGLTLEQLGAWVLLGDVFHQRSSIDDRNEVAPRLQQMADAAPVVIVYGNHDHPGDLQILARLRARYPIVVIDRPQVLEFELATGVPAALVGFPYPHKGQLTAAGVTVADVRETALPLLDAIFLEAAEQLRRLAECGVLPLGVYGHATIEGSTSSVGQPMGLERDIAISANLLARFGDVPKVFGHIHKPQEIYDAWYCGSIGRNDWGEVEDKRYLEIAFSDEDTTITSRPIVSTPLYHVEGLLTRDGFAWRVTRGPDGELLEPPTRWDGAEVRVRYRFNAEDKAALDHAGVSQPFAGAAVLEVEAIGLRQRAIRSEEVAKATTLTEKVAACIRQSGGEWTPALAAKLEALQQPDGVAFLNAIVPSAAPARDTVPA